MVEEATVAKHNQDTRQAGVAHNCASAGGGLARRSTAGAAGPHRQVDNRASLRRRITSDVGDLIALAGHLGTAAPKTPRRVISLQSVVGCVQREWLEQLPVGTCFRAEDVPGHTRGAVYAFLSREAAKPAASAACRRVAPNLYWKPLRNERGTPTEPGHLDIARRIAGAGCGVTGHHAGKITGWLTHTTTSTAAVAVVGAPSVRRPRPGLVLRGRANIARRALSALEVTYLEAVMGFDTCAEVDWPAALRLTARPDGHRHRLRSDRLLEVAAAERGAGAVLLRSRMRQLCEVIDGAPPPVAPDRPHLPPRRRGEPLTAVHLPAPDGFGAGFAHRRTRQLREPLGAAPRPPRRHVRSTTGG